MTNLTDLLPAGAGGKQVSFTASGTLSSGQTVALQSDGTVTAIATSGASVGSGTVFESADSSYVSATFDSNSNKVVISYQDSGNSNYGTAVVGTVSGTSITFGTPVVFESANAYDQSITFDSNANKVVICYVDAGNSSRGTAIVGTVSGTSISFGTASTFNTGVTTQTTATFDSNANKIVVAYRDNGNSSYGTAAVGTVSGTSISFGSETVFQSATTTELSATFDTNSNKVVITYKNGGNSNYGTAIVGTVSGTSISFGTAVAFESATTTYTSATFDSSSNKIVIAYRDGGNSGNGTAIVGTVSGTSISFGSAVVFQSSDTEYISATFDSSNNKVSISYKDNGNTKGKAIVGTVSGTSISFGTAVEYESSSSPQWISSAFDSNAGSVAIAYKDTGNSNYGTAVVLQTVTKNVADFIGIADAAISDTASGNITIKGGIAANGLSSLTPGSTYYVQDDGTLSTTSSSVTAGKALSATSINLDYSS